MPTNQLEAAWPLKKPQQLVYVELGPSNGGMMLGICEQGLSYRAVSALIADGPVQFAFAFDGKTRLEGVGEIVWTEDGGKTGGLKFTNVSPQFQETVRMWLGSDAARKNIGREVTPAAAIPPDSIEKIKEQVRENSAALRTPPQKQPEEPKKQFKPRNWDTPLSEPQAPAEKPPETQLAEAMEGGPKQAEARAETKIVEPAPAEGIAPLLPRIEPPAPASAAPPPAQPTPVAEPPRSQANATEAKPIEATEKKPVEQSVEAEFVEQEARETQPAEKSAVDFLLYRAESKLAEQSRTDSGVALPKLRLPFAPVPAAQEAVIPEIPVEPVAATQAESVPQVAPRASEAGKPASEPAHPPPEEHLPMDEVVTALAAPGLRGLHEPHDFVAHEQARGEESSREFEPPRLNRAAAVAIIVLAVAIIFVALVFSFRREVGVVLIEAGQMLSGEQAKPPAVQSPSAPLSVDDNSYPPVAIPSKPANTQPQPDVSPKPAENHTAHKAGDPPVSTLSGNGQKEFEQARDILKGNHRQRDLPLAVSLLWTGIEKGHVASEVTLADLYARGDGVEKSCDQARVLLEAAIRKGSPEARRRLDLLKGQGCS